jgi:large conductance mechanosensitive channel
VIGAVTGGLDFSNHFIPLSKTVTSPVLSEAKKQGAVIGWGNFLTIAVNFLIIALVLFLVIRAINSLKKSPAARHRSWGCGSRCAAPALPRA